MSSLSEASVGIIFGTDTGNTEDVAEKISEQLEEAGIVAELINITDATPEQMQGFDLTIMGIPTWDFGGIQADWEDVEEMIQALDMGGKLQEHLEKVGARFIGYTSTEGYEFEASRAANEDKTQFCGLAIDEDQQFELTDGRISTWVKQVIAEYEAQA